MAPRAWLLNLDADLELGTRGPYTPSDRVRRATERAKTIIAASLVPEGDAIIGDDDQPGAYAQREARVFSPTTSARARISVVGAVMPEWPSVDVLRQVARRDFAYVPELDGSFVSVDLDRVERSLATPPPHGDGWRLKRAYGMASRGHRVIRGELTPHDRAFVRASIDGLIVEPNVQIVRELGLHGWLRQDGTFIRGTPTEQWMDSFGAWRETRALAASDLDSDTRQAVHSALERAATRLHDARYFGAFGLDAFSYVAGAGLRVRACSEVHARYSMGWAIGFRGHARPDL